MSLKPLSMWGSVLWDSPTRYFDLTITLDFGTRVKPVMIRDEGLLSVRVWPIWVDVLWNKKEPE